MSERCLWTPNTTTLHVFEQVWTVGLTLDSIMDWEPAFKEFTNKIENSNAS